MRSPYLEPSDGSDWPPPTDPYFVEWGVAAIQAAESLAELKAIRDHAESSLVPYRSMGAEIINRALQVQLLAERQAGIRLRQLKLRGGNRRSGRLRTKQSLTDLGITEYQSSKWQKLATIPQAQLFQFVQECNHTGKPISFAGAIRFARLMGGTDPPT